MHSEFAWLSIGELAKELQCSHRSIYQLKADGIFIGGIHFYSIGNGLIRGKCVYNLEDCRKALLERTKELVKNKSIQQSEIYNEDQIKQLTEKRVHRGSQKS